jgi:hypothetical protein
MTVTFATLSLAQNFHLSAETADELAPLIAILVSPSAAGMLTVEVSADGMEALTDALAVVACRMDDPDRIAAVRVDEFACCAELYMIARPVDPRRLN